MHTPQGKGERIVVAIAIELEKCEFFYQTCFVAGEVATVTNPLFTKCHTTNVIYTSLHIITCKAI
jgi:hypothetical protein